MKVIVIGVLVVLITIVTVSASDRKVAGDDPNDPPVATWGINGIKQIRMKCDTASYISHEKTLGELVNLIKQKYKLISVVRLDDREMLISGGNPLYQPNTCIYTLVRQ